MSKLPDTITWAVCQDGDVARPICVEASSDQRLNGFITRYGGEVRTFVRPWGQAWDGSPMDSHGLRILRTGIYRKQKRPIPAPKPDDPPINSAGAWELIQQAAGHHGISPKDLLDPPDRSTRYARARGHAAHMLKHRLNLTLDQIADMLNYKVRSTVWHWLQQPFDLVSTPYRKETKRVRKEKGGLH